MVRYLNLAPLIIHSFLASVHQSHCLLRLLLPGKLLRQTLSSLSSPLQSTTHLKCTLCVATLVFSFLLGVQRVLQIYQVVVLGTPNLSSFLTGVSCSDWRCSSRDALQKHCCEICARIQHPHWTFQPIPAAIGVPRLYPIQVLHWRNVAQYLSRGKLCSTNNYHCII